MKKQLENPFAPLNQQQVENLTEIVKETLARPKTFSTADLWNIQRRGKAIIKRRYFV